MQARASLCVCVGVFAALFSHVSAAECRAGKYKDGYYCVACKVDFYCPGDDTAVGCASDKRSPENSDSIADCRCLPGTYYSDDGDCTSCEADYYCDGEGGNRTACPAYQNAEVGSSSLVDCTCKPGYHLVDGSCAKCKADHYCGGGDADDGCPAHTTSEMGSVAKIACVCTAGWYGDSQGCRYCEPGWFCILGAHTGCPANSNNAMEGSESAADCVCDAGFQRESDEADANCVPEPEPTATVSMSVVLEISESSFTAALRTKFVEGLASALKVEASAVSIVGVSEEAAARRRLLAAGASIAVDTSVTVAATEADTVAARATQQNINEELATTMPEVGVGAVSTPVTPSTSSTTTPSTATADETTTDDNSIILIVLGISLFLFIGFVVCLIGVLNCGWFACGVLSANALRSSGFMSSSARFQAPPGGVGAPQAPTVVVMSSSRGYEPVCSEVPPHV